MQQLLRALGLCTALLVGIGGVTLLIASLTTVDAGMAGEALWGMDREALAALGVAAVLGGLVSYAALGLAFTAD